MASLMFKNQALKPGVLFKACSSVKYQIKKAYFIILSGQTIGYKPAANIPY